MPKGKVTFLIAFSPTGVTLQSCSVKMKNYSIVVIGDIT